jgi:hypothetical protein
MLEITIALAVALVVLAVPRLRRVLLSVMGLAAIIAAGSAVIAVVVWALYQAKPWLTPDEPAVTEETNVPEGKVAKAPRTAETDLTSAIAIEEAQLLAQQQQELAEEKLRIARLVGRTRYILEEDRKFAEHAALNPLPAGVSSSFGNIIAIRIPSWRDSELATRESESIRAWLRSIGLSADETASISTAKAWGSLHDLWVAETQAATPATPEAPEPGVASAPTAPETEQAPQTAPQTAPESVPAPPPQTAPAPPPVARRAPPRREVVRPPLPRTIDPPRRPPPSRPPPREREVGPFGY